MVPEDIIQTTDPHTGCERGVTMAPQQVSVPPAHPRWPSRRPTGGTGTDLEALTYLLAPTTVVEISGAVTRTTTTTYLGDGRVDTSRTTVAGLTGSVPQSGTQGS